jgi:hypothetical protein
VGIISGASVAHAQTTGFTPGHFSVWGEIGFENDLKGNINTSGVGLVAGQRAEIDINSWAERYDAALLVKAGFGYALDDQQQITFTFNWDQAEADQAEIGLLGGQPLTATFTDYQGWGFDAGYRYYAPTASKVKPFVEMAVGVQHVQEIHADMIGAPNLAFNDVPFYNDSYALRGRAGGGIVVMFNSKVGFQLVGNLQYTGALKDQSGLGTLGFERVNNEGRKWNAPLTGGIIAHF